MTLPLLIKAIIDTVVDARNSGTVPSRNTIGMAVGLFGLMVFGNLCIVHSNRIADVAGHKTCGGVSLKVFNLMTDNRYDLEQGNVCILLTMLK